MTETITLYKRRTRALDAERLAALARLLGIEGKACQTDEALAHHDGTRTLACAQPCSKWAGLLFYSDQSVAWGEAGGKLLPAQRAQAWTEQLLAKFELLPRASDGDGSGKLELRIDARETDAIVFDGRERRKVPAKTDVISHIALDGVPVVGPRAKVRAVFKHDERPVMLHVGLWDSLQGHETRERVREHDVIRSVDEKLAQRQRCGQRAYDLRDLRLVYMAGEFAGAPDLLVPEYHVEIELRHLHAGAGKARPAGPAPRQVLRLPAWR
jgi:hypothetical protein